MSKASEFLETVKQRPRFRGPMFSAELADSGMIGFYLGNGDRLGIAMSETTAREFLAWLSDLYAETEVTP